MRYFVPISAVLLGRMLRGVMLCGVMLGCGGLADDGPRAASPELDPDPNGARSAEQLARRAGEPRGEREQEQEQEQPRETPPGATIAGQACGSREGAGAGVVVGTVELRTDPLCGDGSWCLLRAAAPSEQCRGSVHSPADACATEPSIPVPPPRSSVPEWQEETCTCRCDGEASDADYCACPQGMRCAPLIPSAGLDAAARSFIGSYCVY